MTKELGRGVISKPTEIKLGLRIGFGLNKENICIQNYALTDVYRSEAHVDFNEVERLIKLLKEIVRSKRI